MCTARFTSVLLASQTVVQGAVVQGADGCVLRTRAAQGVMLTHANLRYQVDNLSYFLPLRAGDRSLSLLPPWHIYERSCSYYILSRACCQARPVRNMPCMRGVPNEACLAGSGSVWRVAVSYDLLGIC